MPSSRRPAYLWRHDSIFINAGLSSSGLVTQTIGPVGAGLHVNRIVSTSQGLRDQEYDAIVKTLQRYKERRPEYTHVIDECLRVLREDHEARAKPIPHPEMKVE